MRGPGHPTTSEMDYSKDETEFMFAMQEFKRTSGHQFPTWCETLKVLVQLGYHKGEPPVIVEGPVQVVFSPKVRKRPEPFIHGKTLEKMRRIATSEGFNPHKMRKLRP